VAKDTGNILPGEQNPQSAAIEEVLPSIPTDLPVAKWLGQLDGGLACYVLSGGRRIIISQTSRTSSLPIMTKPYHSKRLLFTQQRHRVTLPDSECYESARSCYAAGSAFYCIRFTRLARRPRPCAAHAGLQPSSPAQIAGPLSSWRPRACRLSCQSAACTRIPLLVFSLAYHYLSGFDCKCPLFFAFSTCYPSRLDVLLGHGKQHSNRNKDAPIRRP